MESEEPESCTEEETSDDKHPDWGLGFCVYITGLPCGVGGRPGANCVGNIVGTVSDRHDHGRGDLGVRPEMLDAVVILLGEGVGLLQALIVVADAITGDTLQEAELEERPEAAGVVEREVSDGCEEAFFGFEGLLGGADTLVGYVDVLLESRRLAAGGGAVVVASVVDVLFGLLLRVGWLFDVGGSVFTGRVSAGVVVDDNVTVRRGRVVEPGVVFPEERAERDMVELDASVFLDETAVEVRHEESVGDQEHTAKDTQDNPGSFPGTEFLEIRGVGGLDDHEKSQDGRGEGEVEGDQAHRPSEGILAFQNGIFDRQEEEGRKAGCDARGNTPGGSDLRHTAGVPAPRDTGLGRETNPDQGPDDGLGGGHGEPGTCRNHQPGCTAGLGTGHCEDQDAGFVCETVDVDDIVLDGARDTSSQGDGADELCAHRDEPDLGHRQSPRCDGGSVGVGDIVGAVPEGREAEGDGDEGDDPVILREGHHCDCGCLLETSINSRYRG